MNIQNPPRRGAGAEPRGRKPRRTPKGRQVDPKALAEVQALLTDRSRRRDLPDRAPASAPGQVPPHLQRTHGGTRRRDEAVDDRGLRGRDLLRALRRGEGRRGAAAAGHGAGVRLAVLRDGRRGTAAERSAKDRSDRTSGSCARPAWALAIARRSARSAMCRR